MNKLPCRIQLKDCVEWFQSICTIICGIQERRWLNVSQNGRKLHNHLDLFKIVTPIHIHTFESYLETHPNPLFVQSVCQGLREGFWPWASTNRADYPLINNESRPTPHDIKKAEFICLQMTTELTKNRFSPFFGNELKPGMYCMPIYAIPKPHSSNL